MLKTNTYSRTYSIARENKNSMKPSSSLSKKNVLSESSFLPPQTSPSMIDGFMTCLLLGETFEILHGIVALSPDHGQQQDHISRLMVSNQTADWVSNNSPIGQKRRASADHSTGLPSEFSTIFNALNEDELKLQKTRCVMSFIFELIEEQLA